MSRVNGKHEGIETKEIEGREKGREVQWIMDMECS